MNEIQVMSRSGVVEFSNYKNILEQAEYLAVLVSSTEVTEESIKPVKKMLASVNKKVNELEDERKRVKKELLKPYEAFEQQIKSITSIVKEADKGIRDKVRELEEIEREEKRYNIQQIWLKRSVKYPFVVPFFTFERFIKPQHLNKSMSIDKVEQEMVQWLEQRLYDLEYIFRLDDEEEVLHEYETTLNIAQAVKVVQDKKERQERLNDHLVTDQTIYTMFEIALSDYDKVINFMKSNNIKFNYKGRQ